MSKMGDEASSSRRGLVEGGGGETVVIDHGRRRSTCGYCRSNNYTSICHGLWAQSIKADVYQDLLDRGWRRSGCLLYKPEMERTCCPSYTIRLKACDFLPSKEQVRVQKKMQRFLDGALNLRKPGQLQEMESTKCHNSQKSATGSGISLGETSSGNNEKKCNEDDILQVLSKGVNDAISACVKRGEFPPIVLPKAVVKRVNLQVKRKLMEDLLYTSNISFQIAALLKRAQSVQQNNPPACLPNISQNGSVDFSSNIIAEKLASYIKRDGEPSSLLVKACNGHLNFYASTAQSGFSVSVSNSEGSAQTSDCTSGEKKENCSTSRSVNLPLKKRKLEVRMRRSSFDPEEFSLYKRYQISIHGDLPEKVTEVSYCRFLVDTPITFIPPASDTSSAPPYGFGSFHQQYVIDGKLVAVGVVDILPKCLSSKYFFWDPDLSFLSLGKYSALQEINWVKESHIHCPSLQYYYLGYYIHSCSKMRYKAAYHPSELLCPLRYEWVPFDIARPLLDKKAYVILSDFANQAHEASSILLPTYSNSTSSLSDNNGPIEASIDENDEADADQLLEDEDDKSNSDGSAELFSNELRVFDVSNILIDLNGSRLRFKDLQRFFGPKDKGLIQDLELQLQRYVRVMGKELSSHIIYSL